jgi:hypothetical protein
VNVITSLTDDAENDRTTFVFFPIALARATHDQAVALGLITTAAAFVGLAPLALLVNGLQALPFVAVAVAAVASWVLRRPGFKRPDFTSPKLAEFLLGAVGAVFWFSFSAIIVTSACGLILGLSHLVELVISNEIRLWVEPIVFWLGSILLALIGTICTLTCVSSLCDELYPDGWDANSAYYNLIAHEPWKVANPTFSTRG